MAQDAMTQYSDSLSPIRCSPDERPPLSITPMGQGYLDEELDTARTAWLNAVRKIPARLGAKHRAAVNRAEALKKVYEELLGHPVGKS